MAVSGHRAALQAAASRPAEAASRVVDSAAAVFPAAVVAAAGSRALFCECRMPWTKACDWMKSIGDDETGVEA